MAEKYRLTSRGNTSALNCLYRNGIFSDRQYSLSDAPGNDYLRISVKREQGNAEKPEGQVSNLLHDQFAENAVLDISMPQGEFS